MWFCLTVAENLMKENNFISFVLLNIEIIPVQIGIWNLNIYIWKYRKQISLIKVKENKFLT